MTTESGWVALRTYALETVLQTRSVGGVEIGTSQDEIEVLLGPPEAPIAKASRHSKLRVFSYGNVGLLLSKRLVVGLSIDFHGNRYEMVRAGALQTWRLREWTAFAQQDGWQEALAGDARRLERGADSISMTLDGELQCVLLA